MYSIKNNEEIKKLMILIYKYHQKIQRDKDKQKKGIQIDYQAKIVTKNMIMKFIREIVQDGIAEEEIKEETQQEEFIADISPCFSQEWNIEDNCD